LVIQIYYTFINCAKRNVKNYNLKQIKFIVILIETSYQSEILASYTCFTMCNKKNCLIKKYFEIIILKRKNIRFAQTRQEQFVK